MRHRPEIIAVDNNRSYADTNFRFKHFLLISFLAETERTNMWGNKEMMNWIELKFS